MHASGILNMSYLPYVMVMSRGGFVNGIARDSKSLGSGAGS